MVSTPILVRVLSRPEYGLYAGVLAGFSIVTLLSKGGSFDAVRKTVAEHADDGRAVSSIVSTSFVLSAIYGIVVVVVVLLGNETGVLPSTYAPYVWVLVVTVLFGNLFTIVKGSFFGLQRESIAEALTVTRRLLYVTSGLTLAYVGYGLVGVFAGYALSFVVVAVLGTVLLARHASYTLPTREVFAARGTEIARYGGYQLVGGLSATLLYKADVLLVQFFRGRTATALYQSAIVPAELIWFVPSAIQLAFLQRTASLWSESNVEGIDDDLKTGVKYAVLSLTLFGAGLFALAGPFLRVYFGPEYAEAAPTLRVLIVGTFFFGISRVIVPVLQATGWVRETELVTVVALLINLSLNVALIPHYGVVGAGVGTAASYVFLFVGNTILWIRSPFAVVSPRWILELLSVQAAFSACFLSIVAFSDVSPLLSLLLFPPVGLLLFLGINVKSGYIPISTVRSLLETRIDRG